MNLKKVITDSVTYTNWVHQKYMEWLSKKPEELLNKEVPSSYNSIIKTLNHILSTQEYWWSIINESSEFVPRQNNAYLNKKEIFYALDKNSKKVQAYIASLSEKELQRKVRIKTEWFSCSFSKYDYIQHLVIHSTYHRGQIVTIGRNIGITDAPMTDSNFWNIYKENEAG
ncbi:DinB family protein [Galbibacter pacificus]|uniref:DinB family protein n=1 Tax=Galbibacter pacificus TaxID=2996052 RepID=A0ABT6FNM4_9FLAO|nr:DinB family protein [Galbibacter pacificus]MDG3581391.1 DinB family protein [Galbibacter pacificus]MDG3584869.1 DinB family protein [Galbibacter pacificus]